MKSAASAAFMAVVIGTIAQPTAAEAGKRGWRGGSHHHHHYYHYGSRGSSAAAAGVFGLAAGAVIGSALTQPRVYYVVPPPRPVYYYPAPVAYGPAPWTPDWYAYCASRYPTFHPPSGTYVTYEGYRQICE